MGAAERKTVHVRIEGRVQGVWFRAWSEDEAASRGLDGWVRNCRDGSVEAMFSGPCDRVDDMIAACWEGPPMAEVRNVFESLADEEPVIPGFRLLPTA